MKKLFGNNGASRKFEKLSIKLDFSVLEEKLGRWQKWTFYASLFLLVLFGILLFDVRISAGGDDSDYLVAAKKFIDGIEFPGFHGTFYSIFIGVLIRLFGFHLIFFKVLSLVFLMGHQIFFYLTFRNRISSPVLSLVLLIVAVNSSILFFGSQTYTEALFLFLQSVFFFVFISRMSDLPNDFRHIKNYLGIYLMLGVLFFMMVATRNVGLAALLATIIYFLFNRKYIPALYTFLVYTIVKFPYVLYKKLVWGLAGSDLAGQISSGLQKNPYNKALGNEDFQGMVARFMDNAKIYLSGIFLQITGLKSEKEFSVSMVITLIIAVLLIIGLGIAFRRNRKHMQAVFLYMGISLGITFISLSQMWSQSRLIIVYVPLICLSLTWVFTEIGKKRIRNWLSFGILFLLVFIFGRTLVTAIAKSAKNLPVLVQNIKGNKYFGYAPDFRNYFQLCEWVSGNIPEGETVAARNASMAFIYGNGRFFFPIYKLPVESSDSVLNYAESSGKNVYFISERSLVRKPMKYTLPLKQRLYALISMEHQVYGMYLIDKDEMPQMQADLEKLNIRPILDVGYVREHKEEKDNNPSAVIPDKLVEILKRNQVKFVIMGSLRYDRSKKNGLTINTVQRFLNSVNIKYPGIFIPVKRIGETNDEPAILFKVNYAKYGL